MSVCSRRTIATQMPPVLIQRAPTPANVTLDIQETEEYVKVCNFLGKGEETPHKKQFLDRTTSHRS